MKPAAVLPLLLTGATVPRTALVQALQCRQWCDETTEGGCDWFQQTLTSNFYMWRNHSTCPFPWDSGCAWFKCPGKGEWWGCRANLDCSIPCNGGSKICGTADWSNAAAITAPVSGAPVSVGVVAVAAVAAVLVAGDTR